MAPPWPGWLGWLAWLALAWLAGLTGLAGPGQAGCAGCPGWPWPGWLGWLAWPALTWLAGLGGLKTNPRTRGRILNFQIKQTPIKEDSFKKKLGRRPSFKRQIQELDVRSLTFRLDRNPSKKTH